MEYNKHHRVIKYTRTIKELKYETLMFKSTLDCLNSDASFVCLSALIHILTRRMCQHRSYFITSLQYFGRHLMSEAKGVSGLAQS
jgi:hypothetical protein